MSNNVPQMYRNDVGSGTAAGGEPIVFSSSVPIQRYRQQQQQYRTQPQPTHIQPTLTANPSSHQLIDQGHHTQTREYSPSTSNTSGDVGYPYPHSQSQPPAQVPSTLTATNLPQSLNSSSPVAISNSTYHPSYPPSISDSTSVSSFSGPPSPMTINSITVQPQTPIDVESYTHTNNSYPTNNNSTITMKPIPNSTNYYSQQKHVNPNYYQSHPQIGMSTLNLNGRSNDTSTIPWNGNGYDHSPYSASAESYSPSSSSNNGGNAVVKKFTNACKRCRRQKMKCTFKEGQSICTRCFLGSHQCVLEERKSRNPGELEVIRGRLRNTATSLDQAIDKLRDVNTSQYETPLSFIPNRVALTQGQREELRDVLGNVIGNVGGRKTGAGAIGMEDVRALLMEEESEESDVSGNESEGEVDGDEDSLDGSGGSENGDSKRSAKPKKKGSRDSTFSFGGSGKRGFSGGESVLPDSMTPLGFMIQTTLEERADENGYFQSSPLTNASLRSILIERGDEAPPILTHGLFTLKDVETLFDLYFKRIHPIVCLLDPAIHTPSSILLRSPFLFTVICAISCRFAMESEISKTVHRKGTETPVNGNATKTKSKKRSAAMMDSNEPSKTSKKSIPDLSSRYPLALHYAKVAAASALIDGRKNVEMVQAYLLMALYAPNGKRFEESRTLFYSGVASTVAVELGLHRIVEKCPGDGKDERAAREWNNLIRTWIICFNLDRCYSVQYGKPLALKEDFHVLNKDWYRVPFANAYDVHLHGHTDLLRIMARFHQSIRAEKNVERIPHMIDSFEKEVDELAIELKEHYLREADMTDEGCCFRLKLAEFVSSYSRLLILSHGLQQSFENGVAPDPVILTNALRIATAAINSYVGTIASTGFWRFSPDCYFIYSGYCATFLLKLIDSKFPYPFDEVQKERIIALVQGLVDTLASPEISIDERHTPKLYAGFLAGLLKRVGGDFRSKKRMRVVRKSEPEAKPEPKVKSKPEKIREKQTSATSTSSFGSIGSIGSIGSSSFGSSVSPISVIADTQASPLGEVNNNGSWTGTDYMSEPSTISAFPAVADQGYNGYYRNTTNGSLPPSHYPQQQQQQPIAPVMSSNGEWVNPGTHMNPSLTWEDVYATPDMMMNSHHQQPMIHEVGNINMLTGHPMNMGSQWNFNADEMTSPYSKWSMEDLVPTVSYLMPTA